MSVLKIHKVLSALPGTPEADALYLIRTGSGFDLYATDDTGAIAYKSNVDVSGLITISTEAPINPSLNQLWFDIS